MSIIMTVYCTDDITREEMVKKFLRYLSEINLQPEKIGLFEPLRDSFSFEKTIEMWTKEEPGCYQEGVGMIGKAGGITAKSKNPKYQFDVQWWKCPERANINYINFHFPVKVFSEYQSDIINLFKKIILIFNGIYGYISHEKPRNRQHVTGTLETRLPGVFWCNYFGEVYTDFIGKEKILSFPWWESEVINENGILTFLTLEPNKELLKSEDLEVQAKHHLGVNLFGDVDRFKANPNSIQVKNVPSLK